MKINIKNVTGEKKYTHVIPCQTETTSQFGFYQPIFCRECASQDTVSLRSGSLVRLQPISKPTFGRLSIKQYTNFVPIADIWHAHESFLSGKSYSGAIAQYIPTEFPSVPFYLLNLFCIACSDIHVIHGNTFTKQVNYGFTFSSFECPTEDANAYVDAVIHSVLAAAGPSYDSQYLEAMFQDYTPTTVHSLPEPEYDPETEHPIDKFSPDMYDWMYPVETSAGNVDLVCGRFTDRGRNLRKIFIGLGYQLNFDVTPVDLVRIVGFYKTWFDMFAVQREVTWKDTHAFNFMEYIEQANCANFGAFVDSLTGEPFAQRAFDSFFAFFFHDLPEMYYTQNPDYISAHIVGTAISQSYNSFNYLNSEGDNAPIDNPDHTLPSFLGDVNQQGLDILKQLYQYTNIATVVGGRIKEFMRSIFGSEYKQEEESTFIGTSSMTIDISPVMSTAETEQGYLGEYAGKGEGDSQGTQLKYTCPSAGYIYTGFCVVPDARFVQGVDPNIYHHQKFDFFTQQFDSLTLVPSRKSIVYAVNELGTDSHYSDGFGNIPNYMEYKQSFDRLNGDMSLRSTRGNLLSYSLSKLLYFGDCRVNKLRGRVFVDCLPSSLLVAGDIWRYIGKDKWLGNFDRIFQNAGQSANNTTGGENPQWNNSLDRDRLDDNFILYFYNDVTVTGFELPVADSFQTDPFGANLTVEKA